MRDIKFENYRDKIIKDFEEDLQTNGYINNNGLTSEALTDIYERFEDHRGCFEDCIEEFNAEDQEMITVANFIKEDKTINVAIECNCCESIIIDDEVLFMEDEI